MKRKTIWHRALSSVDRWLPAICQAGAELDRERTRRNEARYGYLYGYMAGWAAAKRNKKRWTKSPTENHP